MLPSHKTRILVATHPVYFRKGHDGLASLVQSALKEDPFSGTVFVFRAKRADRLKILFWDGTGLVFAIGLERIATRWLRIRAARGYRTWCGLALAVYALLLYPLLGSLAGHEWPAVPVFGVAPCPTTIFTIGVLLLGDWPVARWLLVIPAAWGVLGGRAAVLLDIPQDYGLVLALLVVLGTAALHVFGSGLTVHPRKAH